MTIEARITTIERDTAIANGIRFARSQVAIAMSELRQLDIAHRLNDALNALEATLRTLEAKGDAN